MKSAQLHDSACLIAVYKYSSVEFEEKYAAFRMCIKFEEACTRF